MIKGSANIGPTTGGGPCTYPMTIAPGANCIAQISFQPAATGAKSAAFRVDSDGGSASVTLSGTGVLPPADVAVSVGATPSPATAGKPLTYTITVRNAGPGAAERVQLTDVVPSSTTFASISAPPDVVCTTPAVGGTGTVSCSVNTSLQAGGTRTITLVVKLLSGGRSAITNSVSASPDSNGANNSATVVTTVYGRK